MDQDLFKHDRTGTESDAFFDALQKDVLRHPALHHPFLVRFGEEKLSAEQLARFAAQHYMYSRFFTRNLAGAVANIPDENARSLLILNMYEEIGEPLQFRYWAHRLLLEAGVVSAADVGAACIQALSMSEKGDPTLILIEKGLVTRPQVAAVVNEARERAGELTHPALFRRFLHALSLEPRRIDEIRPIPETTAVIEEYHKVCHESHWLEAMGAMGPGTECVVPVLYSFLHRGIERSGKLSPEAYIFWTIHIHCDEGHGKNIVDAMAPFARTRKNQEMIRAGMRRVLNARAAWFDGLQRLVFGTVAAGKGENIRGLSA